MNMYANKSTASRELGKMGIPQKLRAALIKNDVAPFEVSESEVRKVLKKLKADAKQQEQQKANAVTESVNEALAEQAAADKVANELLLKAAASEKTAALVETIVPVVEVKAVEKATVAEPTEPKVDQNQSTGRAKRESKKQNGKTHPQRGVCAAIWEELDNMLTDLSGQVPTPAQAQQLGVANNWHKVTVYRQYNDWKVYHGHKTIEE